MSLKKLKHFELMKMDASYNTAKFQIRRHNKKNEDNVRLKKIDGCAYAYRDIFDLKDITEHEKHSILKELSDYLDSRKIIESDEEII